MIDKHKFLIAVVSSQEHNHNDSVNIDRVDLTRKLDMLNTWVEDAFYNDIDVIFMVGGHDKTEYFKDSLTLKLNVNDGYESNTEKSKLFKKIQKCFQWILENKEFDYLYLCDDDIYINIDKFKNTIIKYDYISYGPLGGGGFFFSKKAMEKVINHVDYKSHVSDQELYQLMSNSPDIKNMTIMPEHCPYYIPAENYTTVHYCTGKRVYNLHNTLKLYKETGKTYRKILLGYPLNNMISNPYITYESTKKRKTKRWYDFTKDPNGWEYHGGYTRSDLSINALKSFWPYSEGASKYFVICVDNIFNDYRVNNSIFYQNLNFIIQKAEMSCIDKEDVFLISNSNEEIDGWIIDKSLNKKLSLTFENLINYNIYKKLK